MKKLFPVFTVGIIVIIGYFVYQLVYLPQQVKLPFPTKLPFFSVVYLYRIQTEALISSSVYFGSEKVPATDVSTKIKEDMQAIKKTGFEGVKLNFHFKGNNYFPNRIALKAAQVGLYPIGTLTGHSAKPKDRAFTADELTQWKSFAADVVKTNKNIIYFWEIWNEPDVNLFYYGKPEEYLTLLKETSQIIKRENPNAKIIVTLNLYSIDQDSRRFSERVLALGGGNYFDILSFHPYSGEPYIQEQSFKSQVENMKRFVSEYNNRWPLWISEIGQPASQVSEEKQASLARMIYQETIKDNIPTIWLHYTDQRIIKEAPIGDATDWGLVRNDGSQRPVYKEIVDFINKHE